MVILRDFQPPLYIHMYVLLADQLVHYVVGHPQGHAQHAFLIQGILAPPQWEREYAR